LGCEVVFLSDGGAIFGGGGGGAIFGGGGGEADFGGGTGGVVCCYGGDDTGSYCGGGNDTGCCCGGGGNRGCYCGGDESELEDSESSSRNSKSCLRHNT
jgi:hypothetical protein